MTVIITLAELILWLNMKRPAGTYLVLCFLLMAVPSVHAQNGSSISVDEYVSTYKDLAIEDMKTFGIPASIKLAQGILESGSGNSELATKANNHFGIKCHKGWTGKTFIMDDDHKNECFRKYKSPEDSWRDHSMFLTTRERYAGLFSLPVTDYRGWAYGLKKAGYATNPRYPELLIKIIEENGLNRYDGGRSGAEMIAASKSKNPQLTERNGEPALTFRDVFGGHSPVDESPAGRPVYENNGVRFIFVEKGDNFYSLAGEFEIYAWQLWKYNELNKKLPIREGNILYLEKKKRRAEKRFKTHIARPGETMPFISQLYGVKLKRLYRLNDLSPGTRPAPGEEIRLR